MLGSMQHRDPSMHCHVMIGTGSFTYLITGRGTMVPLAIGGFAPGNGFDRHVRRWVQGTTGVDATFVLKGKQARSASIDRLTGLGRLVDLHSRGHIGGECFQSLFTDAEFF